MSKEVLKLALEALEKLVRFESDSWELGSCRIAGQATKALREALAEQPAQQEPVAIGWYIEGFSCVLGPIRPEVRYEEWRPFYALRTPAQRTWVGLPKSAFTGMTLQQVSAMQYAEQVLKDENT